MRVSRPLKRALGACVRAASSLASVRRYNLGRRPVFGGKPSRRERLKWANRNYTNFASMRREPHLFILCVQTSSKTSRAHYEAGLLIGGERFDRATIVLSVRVRSNEISKLNATSEHVDVRESRRPPMGGYRTEEQRRGGDSRRAELSGELFTTGEARRRLQRAAEGAGPGPVTTAAPPPDGIHVSRKIRYVNKLSEGVLGRGSRVEQRGRTWGRSPVRARSSAWRRISARRPLAAPAHISASGAPAGRGRQQRTAPRSIGRSLNIYTASHTALASRIGTRSVVHGEYWRDRASGRLVGSYRARRKSSRVTYKRTSTKARVGELRRAASASRCDAAAAGAGAPGPTAPCPHRDGAGGRPRPEHLPQALRGPPRHAPMTNTRPRDTCPYRPIPLNTSKMNKEINYN
ncbi:hypothetical protein EVAR_88378_1 [Eumeta japonica]|uniref:Uncharacterized protein n=1 Tax=Eumeta variegata TaxID=151549 RepID=A0A4C1XC29_EUMVA|nr:hypothetical protein EVAR_88378_1 [Eumeta japonica]